MVLFFLFGCPLKKQPVNLSPFDSALQYIEPSEDTVEPEIREVFSNPIMVSTSLKDAQWINGVFEPCTDVPCGHLSEKEWNDEIVYVKKSGLSSVSNEYNSDGSPSYYWAYIFQYSKDKWVIQYVSPDLKDAAGNYLWNAFRYGEGTSPLSANWIDLQVSEGEALTIISDKDDESIPKDLSTFNPNQQLYIQSSVANIRTEPDSKSSIVESVLIGTSMYPLEEVDDWIKVQIDDRNGWVFKDLLGPIKLTSDQALFRFDSSTDLLEKRKWIERAAALEPTEVEIIQLLINTLEQLEDKDSLEKAREGYRTLLKSAPIYFTNKSFVDGAPIDYLDLIHSPLSCRNIISDILLKEAPKIWEESTEWKFGVTGSKFWDLAKQYCNEFQEDRIIWSLIKTEGLSYSWQKIDLEPTLEVRTYIDASCGSGILPPPNSILELTFESNLPQQPVLFLSQKESFDVYDVSFAMLPISTQYTSEEFEREGRTIRREYLLNNDDRFAPFRVFLESEIGDHPIASWDLKDIVLKIRLVVEWSPNNETILYSAEGRSKYSYHPPFISDIAISDLNQDGGTDFIFRTAEGGYQIVETEGSSVGKVHTLEIPMEVPLGGC